MPPRAKRNDQKALQDEAAQGSGRAWGRLRLTYSPEVREVVDDVAQGGGLSLRDLILLEMAELLTMRAELQGMTDPGDRVVERISSLMLQSRKNLRSLVEALGDVGDVDTRPVRVPEGLRVLPGPDEGDDLL